MAASTSSPATNPALKRRSIGSTRTLFSKMDLNSDHLARAERLPIAASPPRSRSAILITLLINGVLGCLSQSVSSADTVMIGADFVLTHHLVASGSTSRSPDDCLRLQASSGEAVAGHASGGGYSLQIGYWPAATAALEPSIFDNGFETQECLP